MLLSSSSGVVVENSGTLPSSSVRSMSKPTTSSNAKSNFFTASHLVETINNTMKTVAGGEDIADAAGRRADDDGTSNSNSVELFRRLPNGSAVPVDEADMKITDSKMKMKQAAERIASLGPEEKLLWAREQRLEGNRLFHEEKFVEAMDIYLTCLVAVDYRTEKSDDETQNLSTDVHDNKRNYDGHHNDLKKMMEQEVQLPVLLNLAACGMKLQRYRKVEEFCTIALNDLSVTNCGQHNVKVWYRRGKARMHLGLYDKSKYDYQMALNIADTSTERNMIEKDISKLESLIRAEKLDEASYKNALRGFFKSNEKTKPLDRNDNAASESLSYTKQPKQSKEETKSSSSDRLYSTLDQHNNIVPKYSTLRATPKLKRKKSSNVETALSSKIISKSNPIGLITWAFSCFIYYWQSIWEHWTIKNKGQSCAKSR